MDGTTEAPLWTAASPSAGQQMPAAFDVFGVAVVAIGLFGVVGNALTLHVFVRARQFSRSTGGMLIVNQTTTDLFCSCVLIVTHAYKMNPIEVYQKGKHDLLCFFIHGEVLLYIALTASTYNLIIITLERYLMVVHPIAHRSSWKRSRAVTVIIASWLVASLHPVIANIYTTYISEQGRCSVYVWGRRRGREAAQIVYFMSTYILPIVFFIGAYARIWFVYVNKRFQVGAAVQTVSRRLEPKPAEGPAPRPRKLTRSQKNFTLTAILVVAAFIVLWMPFEICTMLLNFGVPTRLGLRVYKIALALTFLNCVVNPIIYAFQMENFKKAFVKYLCVYKCARVEAVQGTSVELYGGQKSNASSHPLPRMSSHAPS